jgi:hypothetical protein
MSQLLTPASLEDVIKPIQVKINTEFSKTQKNSSKLTNLLKTLQEMDDDDTTSIGEFNPPPKPMSVGSQRTTNVKEGNMYQPTSTPPGCSVKAIPSGSPGLELNSLKFTYPEPSNLDAYYKKYIPASNQPNSNLQFTEGYSNASPVPNSSMPSDIPNAAGYTGAVGDNRALLDKLNYMIHLLEDKQDVKSNSKIEEIGLYCLLGIFTIFLVDSFSRVGKYVR